MCLVTTNKSNTKTIAITGASGFLGAVLTDYFSSNGWQVIALVRDPSKQTKISNVSYKEYDILKPVKASTLNNVDVLVHAAYVKYDADHPDALEQNVAGVQSLLSASHKAGVKKNVFISSMSSHDEAISVYGRQKLASELLFNPKKDVVFRCGLILGNGGIVREMALFMRSKHAVPLIGGGKQPLQVVGVADLARAVDAAATKPLTGRFVVATPQVYTYKQFYTSLTKSLKVKVVFVPLPFKALQLAFRTAALLRLPLGVGEDSLNGLKMLRSMESASDLEKLGIQLDDLETVLSRITIE